VRGVSSAHCIMGSSHYRVQTNDEWVPDRLDIDMLVGGNLGALARSGVGAGAGSLLPARGGQSFIPSML